MRDRWWRVGWSDGRNFRAAAAMFTLAAVALLTGVGWAWHAWASPHTPAVVADCHQIVVARGRWYPGGQQTVDACRVSWSTDDSRHSGIVDLPVGHYQPGDTVTVTIHAGSAEGPASPQPLIYLAAISIVAATFGRWLLPPPNRSAKRGRATRKARPVDVPRNVVRDDVPAGIT